jgi:hypothetical protein
MSLSGHPATRALRTGEAEKPEELLIDFKQERRWHKKHAQSVVMRLIRTIIG